MQSVCTVEQQHHSHCSRVAPGKCCSHCHASYPPFCLANRLKGYLEKHAPCGTWHDVNVGAGGKHNPMDVTRETNAMMHQESTATSGAEAEAFELKVPGQLQPCQELFVL